VLVLILCLGTLAAAAKGKGYELSIDTVNNVGDVFQVEAEMSMDTIGVRRDVERDRALNYFHKTSEADIKGRMTILALAQNGDASKVKVRVDMFRVFFMGKIILDAKAGDELVLERLDKPNEKGLDYVALLNGRELIEEQTGLTALALDLARPKDKYTADQIFNMAGKKQPGDSWAINTELFMQAAADEEDKMVKGQAPKASMTFSNIIGDRRELYALLKGEITADGWIPKAPGTGVISNEVSEVVTIQAPLEAKVRKLYVQTERTAKTVSGTYMKTDGRSWTLRQNTTLIMRKKFRIEPVPAPHN
jgi:hypothetical protein